MGTDLDDDDNQLLICPFPLYANSLKIEIHKESFFFFFYNKIFTMHNPKICANKMPILVQEAYHLLKFIYYKRTKFDHLKGFPI